MSELYGLGHARRPDRAEIARLERLSRSTDLFARADGNFRRLSMHSWLWCLLFGVFYFAYHRAWNWTVITLAAAILTFGVAWLVFPFFARSMLRRQIMKDGYLPVH